MNILFLSLMKYNSILDRDIYTDLLREFIIHGHDIYLITPTDEDHQRKVEDRCTLIKVPVGKIEKTSFIKKGINTILIGFKFKNSIKKYLNSIKFDLVLFPTPPITFVDAIQFVKKRDNAKVYLMLKDIFPQNALDLGIMQKSGIKGVLYTYFRKKEKRLYSTVDYIGCMSPANVKYLLQYNPELDEVKVGLCANCVKIEDKSISFSDRARIRKKYGIPEDKVTIVYGGNLGKPQGIEFLINCIRALKDIDIYVVIVGSGTEKHKIEEYINRERPCHVKFIPQLEKDEYDSMVGSCDIGLICLDYRFTIPNFPSRMLSYMQAKMPILAMTDPNTDVGQIIEENNLGWSCMSNDIEAFVSIIEIARNSDLKKIGNNSWNYLCEHYDVAKQYHEILRQICE